MHKKALAKQLYSFLPRHLKIPYTQKALAEQFLAKAFLIVSFMNIISSSLSRKTAVNPTQANCHSSIFVNYNVCSVLPIISSCVFLDNTLKNALYPATRTIRSLCFSGCFWASIRVSLDTILYCT